MTALSTVFHDFFLATTNLTFLHLGSPSKKPLPLEQIIHPAIQWNRLHTFSLESWILGAEELISFIRRHSHLLREIRLNTIYLRDGGGRWKDVLAILRDVEVLQRIELRDINYAEYFAQGPRGAPDGAVKVSDVATEQLRSLTIDDLGDDGVVVRDGQDRLWEAWVMARVRY